MEPARALSSASRAVDDLCRNFADAVANHALATAASTTKHRRHRLRAGARFEWYDHRLSEHYRAQTRELAWRIKESVAVAYRWENQPQSESEASSPTFSPIIAYNNRNDGPQVDQTGTLSSQGSSPRRSLRLRIQTSH